MFVLANEPIMVETKFAVTDSCSHYAHQYLHAESEECSQVRTKAATIIQPSAAMEAYCTRVLARNRKAMAMAASTYVTLTAALFTPRRLAVKSVPGGGSPKTLLDMPVATCRGRHIEWTEMYHRALKIETRFDTRPCSVIGHSASSEPNPSITFKSLDVARR